ncbi:hypothetical protein JKG47_01095 [Acidithiobacillus sp. MC6.1]|nr:hypothetical protein [Acidithiobacillus sp. MC6.1]
MWILRTVAMGIFFGSLLAFRDPKLLDPETKSLLYVLSSISVGLVIASVGWPIVERMIASIRAALEKSLEGESK